MICPYCKTINRDDVDVCYHCNRDLSMLRLIHNKANDQYIMAIEHAERGRYTEAILALQNVLDLDRHNVNAHVVLGTVYARTGNMDKAVEQWKEALKLEPMLLKAHDYINRAIDLKRSSHRIKILAYAGVVLIILLVVNIGLFLASTLPEKEEKLLDRAWNSYLANNYHSALSLLTRIEQNVNDPGVLSSAQILKENIERYITDQLQVIRDAEREGRFYDALTLTRETLRRKPPPELNRLLTTMISDIRGVLLRNIHRQIRNFYSNPASFPWIKAEVEKFIISFPEDNEIEILKKNLSRLERHYVSSMIDRLRQEASAGNVENAIESAHTLLEEYPEYSSPIAELVESLRTATVKTMIKEMESRIEKGQLRDAYRILEQAREQISLLSRESLKEISALIGEDLRVHTGRLVINALEKLFNRGEYTRLLDSAPHLDLYVFSDAQRQKIDALLTAARLEVKGEEAITSEILPTTPTEVIAIPELPEITPTPVPETIPPVESPVVTPLPTPEELFTSPSVPLIY